jgi:hypothetical protein
MLKICGYAREHFTTTDIANRFVAASMALDTDDSSALSQHRAVLRPADAEIKRSRTLRQG